MRTSVIDTNAFIRFFLNDIPSQKKAVEMLLQQAKDQKMILLVPQVVIFEINYILGKYYGFPKEEIIDKLDSLVATKYLQIENRNELGMTLKLYENNSLSLADCLLVITAKQEGAELFTFDKRLQKLHGEI